MLFEDLLLHKYAPTEVIKEKGERHPEGGEVTLMVDCALHAMQELMEEHPESLLYGQDVGKRLGGVFREAATLGDKFGDERVFNTPIQEAFIIGSTVGMSCVGLRPIGAYGSGGPYHSSSVESVLSNIIGIKVAYPSNGADLKGLIKAAFHDPNPVVMLEHKGLYWSKIPGTDEAKCIEPSSDYIVPLGKARTVLEVNPSEDSQCSIITYGRGVYWAKEAAEKFPGAVEIIDLRSIVPLDMEAIAASVAKTNRCLILTEEPVENSFGKSLSGRISSECFESLDAAPKTLGSASLPAIPLNSEMEAAMLPSANKVEVAIEELLSY